MSKLKELNDLTEIIESSSFGIGMRNWITPDFVFQGNSHISLPSLFYWQIRTLFSFQTTKSICFSKSFVHVFFFCLVNEVL